MRIIIAGASGMIGQALTCGLREAGHEVFRLVRRAAAEPNEVSWNPAAGEIDAARLETMDAVINLSGENIGAGRWTATRRERILRSRIDATRTLVSAMAKRSRQPAVFLSASAVGYYGDRGDEVLTERASIGHGFLPEVCLAWETHAEGAARAGIRTVLLRFGVVLSAEGGALAKMLPLFRVGLGGPLGRGNQWMSWIALPDVVGIVDHALTDSSLRGPVNVVAQHPVLNREFAATLGRVLRRPAFIPAPAVALNIVFGQMARETILISQRAVPERLEKAGYLFAYPDLESALRAILDPPPRG
jgi:uncharacterized protein (TIGR01777 family)